MAGSWKTHLCLGLLLALKCFDFKFLVPRPKRQGDFLALHALMSPNLLTVENLLHESMNNPQPKISRLFLFSQVLGRCFLTVVQVHFQFLTHALQKVQPVAHSCFAEVVVPEKKNSSSLSGVGHTPELEEAVRSWRGAAEVTDLGDLAGPLALDIELETSLACLFL